MTNLFHVSAKAVIFNQDKTRVLVIFMDRNNDYGLPGGHINKGEDIEQALRRELYEECGISAITLAKADFFLHSNGKLVLAFIGQLNDRKKFTYEKRQQEGAPLWLTKDEFCRILIEPNYKKLVLNNW